jgi:4-diphosphocytidyl-2-C-methyl-D-erythritol kinase
MSLRRGPAKRAARAGVRKRAALVEHAPAKVNVTLSVLGRRADGYHAIDSVVVFARLGDRLTLTPGERLALTARGINSAIAGALDDNLVLKAARGLAAKVPGLRLGRFTLEKRLPVAAGLGGGSADAAAALRLLARANRISLKDDRLLKVAQKIGADVPVCVDPRARRMRGIGEILSAPLAVPPLAAVLANPGVAVPTRDVFAALDLAAGAGRRHAAAMARLPRNREAFIAYIAAGANDLEPAAIKLQPVIARVLAALRKEPGCRLARMTGSGATCFGLFGSSRAAAAAARSLAVKYPRWWVRATVLG